MMEGHTATANDVNHQEQVGEAEPNQQSETVGVKHSSSRVHAVKKVLGGIMPSGKRERLFTMIILAIILIWAIVWMTNRGYPFWPGLAGVLTIPLLLAALMIDNAYKE